MKKFTSILSIVFSLQLLVTSVSYAYMPENVIVHHQTKKKKKCGIKRILKLILGVGETGIGITQWYLYYTLNKTHFDKDFLQKNIAAIKSIFDENNKFANTEKIRRLHQISALPVSGSLLTIHGINNISQSLEG